MLTVFLHETFLVPLDGTKGKTWGPSSVHQKERGKIISKVESPKRWSKSAPNLDKSQKSLSVSSCGPTHSGRCTFCRVNCYVSMQMANDGTLCSTESFDNERIIGSVPLIPLPNVNCANSETRRAKKYSPVQQVLYNAAALLAQIAAGFDIRKKSSSNAQQATREGMMTEPDPGPRQIVFLKGFQNNGFGDSDSDINAEALTLSSAPAALMGSGKVENIHSTYHGHPHHQYRPSPWSPMMKAADGGGGANDISTNDSTKYLNISSKPLTSIATNGVAHFHHDRRNKSATSTPSRSALTTPTHRKYSPANSHDSEVRPLQFYDISY